MNTLEHIKKDKRCVICDTPIPLSSRNRLYCNTSHCQEAKRAIAGSIKRELHKSVVEIFIPKMDKGTTRTLYEEYERAPIEEDWLQKQKNSGKLNQA